MNAKQLFSIAVLLTASGVALAQAPAAEKPGVTVTQSAGAEAKKRMDQKPVMPEGKKAKSSAHDHKEDGPKKNIYSGA